MPTSNCTLSQWLSIYEFTLHELLTNHPDTELPDKVKLCILRSSLDSRRFKDKLAHIYRERFAYPAAMVYLKLQAELQLSDPQAPAHKNQSTSDLIASAHTATADNLAPSERTELEQLRVFAASTQHQRFSQPPNTAAFNTRYQFKKALYTGPPCTICIKPQIACTHGTDTCDRPGGGAYDPIKWAERGVRIAASRQARQGPSKSSSKSNSNSSNSKTAKANSTVSPTI